MGYDKQNIYDVVVIGSGITGITAGKYLNQNGFSVIILDKGKAIGGRLATRRFEADNQKLQIDYGCKFIESNSNEFTQELVDLIKNNTLKKWNIVNQNVFLNELEKSVKFIGRQSIRQIAIELSRSLNISNNVKVKNIIHVNGVWKITDENENEIKSESIILTMPVPQSLDLIHNSQLKISDKIIKNLEYVKYARSIVGIFVLENKSNLQYEGGLKFEDGPISFITDNNMKGVNSGFTAVTVEMGNEFSLGNWENSDEVISQNIVDVSQEWLGSKVLHSQIHKWKFSTPIKSYPKKFEAVDSPGLLYFAGDAFLGSNVESAYLSGLSAAKNLLQELSFTKSETTE